MDAGQHIPQRLRNAGLVWPVETACQVMLLIFHNVIIFNWRDIFYMTCMHKKIKFYLTKFTKVDVGFADEKDDGNWGHCPLLSGQSPFAPYTRA